MNCKHERTEQTQTGSKPLVFRMGAGGTCRIPPGEYIAQVVGADIDEKYRRKILTIRFEILGGPNDGTLLRGFANVGYEVFSPETKIRQWAERACGREIEDGEIINIERVFMDGPLRVEVGDVTTKKTGAVVSNVVDILGPAGEL